MFIFLYFSLVFSAAISAMPGLPPRKNIRLPLVLACFNNFSIRSTPVTLSVKGCPTIFEAMTSPIPSGTTIPAFSMISINSGFLLAWTMISLLGVTMTKGGWFMPSLAFSRACSMLTWSTLAPNILTGCPPLLARCLLGLFFALIRPALLFLP